MKKLLNILDKIKISPITVIFMIFSVLFGQGKPFLLYFMVSVIHELAHFLFCLLFNVSIQQFTLLPFGVSMEVLDIDKISSIKQIIIYIAGPLSFIVTFLLFTCLKKINLINENNFNFLTKVNYLMALFNLIPIFPLDGYRILKAILQLFIPYKKALKISNIISFICYFLFLMINFISIQIMLSSFLLSEQLKNIKNFKIVYKYFLISKTNKIKHKKYKMIDDYQMYKDLNNYKVENENLLSDYEIATRELKYYL